MVGSAYVLCRYKEDVLNPSKKNTEKEKLPRNVYVPRPWNSLRQFRLLNPSFPVGHTQFLADLWVSEVWSLILAKFTGVRSKSSVFVHICLHILRYLWTLGRTESLLVRGQKKCRIFSWNFWSMLRGEAISINRNFDPCLWIHGQFIIV
jgi:hypothetical protein